MNERYKYYVAGRKVVCVSSYAKQKVRGVAICSDNDEFNEDVGKALARQRCDVKIARKRFRRAERRLATAIETKKLIEQEYDAARDYFTDSWEEYNNATAALGDFERML